MPSIGGDEAWQMDGLLGGVTVQSTWSPGRELFRSSNIKPTKRTKHLWNIPQKIGIFCWVGICIVVVSIHHQFFGGLDFQGRNQLEPTRKKLRSVRVTGIWRKFMAPVPLPVPSFKPPPGGWEEGIRQGWFLVLVGKEGPGTCWETRFFSLGIGGVKLLVVAFKRLKNYLWFWSISHDFSHVTCWKLDHWCQCLSLSAASR